MQMVTVLNKDFIFGKINRYDLSLYINVSVAYLSWFSSVSYTLYTSFPWM